MQDRLRALRYHGVNKLEIIRKNNANTLVVAPDLMNNLSTKPTKFLGSFVTNNPYRGKPGPKVDMAWMKWHEFRKCSKAGERHELTNTALLRVTEDDVKKSFNHETDPEYRSTVIEMEGGGYLATVELFHQMHCLVSL